MWREPDEIRTDLDSGDAARVGRALEDLREASDGFDEFPMPYPGLRPLQGLALPSQELQLALTTCLTRYGSFEPPPGPKRVAQDVVALALAYGNDRIAMEASFLLKADPALLAEGLEALERDVQASGVRPGARRLASYLLAGAPEVRAATVKALGRPALAPLQDSLRPEL